MSKRPVGMYFVIVWFVIFSFIHLQTVRRIVFQYNVKSGIRFIFAAALVLLIWEIYGLFKLKSIPRWICIVLLGWWALSSLVKIPSITSPPFPSARNALIMKAILGGISLVNVVIIWYLSRPSFRNRCVQYCKEQDKRKQEQEITKKFV